MDLGAGLTIGGAVIEITGVLVLANDVSRAVRAPGPIRRRWDAGRESIRRAWTGDPRQVDAGEVDLSGGGGRARIGFDTTGMTDTQRLDYYDLILQTQSATLDQLTTALKRSDEQAAALRKLIEEVPKEVERRSLAGLGELAPRLLLGTMLVVLGTAVSAAANLV